jgi:hypothetical protein
MTGLTEQRNAPFLGAWLADAADFDLSPAAERDRVVLRKVAVFLAILAGYTALTALFFWQVLPHLSSALLGPPEDNLNDFWNSWYALQKHPDGFFFTHLLRYPEGTALHYHSFAYPQILTVWVLAKCFGTSLPILILLQNLTILASFPLGGLAAFYLCRHLGGGTIGSAAGGFIFAFSPWHVAQAMHHALGTGVEFLPCFVLYYLRALKHRSYRSLATATLFYALSALSGWYYLFYGFYFLAFHILYLRVHQHSWPRGWNLLAPSLCLAGLGVILSPLILPMIVNGFGNGAYQPGSNIFVADLLGYTAFPPTHLLAAIGSNLYSHFTGNPWEDTVYLGLVNLAILAWGLWRAQKGERLVLWYALGGMIFFAMLASGDALHWMGRTLPIHMPGIVLSKLPFFANVRTPARAIVFVYLFMGVGVAATIAAVLKSRRTIVAGIALSLALALSLIDFFPANLETTAMSCSPALSILADDRDRDFGVLDLPYGYSEGDFYMAQQACHGRPIAQGVIARQMAPTTADHLNIRDLAVQRRELTAAKIKYILIHHPTKSSFAWAQQYDGNLESYRRTYPVAADGPDITILRVY